MQTFYLDPTAGVNGSGLIGSPFNTMANAVSSMQAAFNSATEDYELVCLAGQDNSTTTPQWSLDASSSTLRTLRIYADGANRHTGVRGTGYRLPGKRIDFFSANANINVELRGVAALGYIFGLANLRITADACVSFDQAAGAAGFGIGGGSATLRNCLSAGGAGDGFHSSNENGSPTVKFINCTSLNNAGAGFSKIGGSNPVDAINSYAGGNTGADFTGLNSVTNCHSEDGTQSTTTAAYTTANFTSVTAGSENSKLPSGSALIAAGVGPASNANVPSVDFEGTTRGGSTTDVGFDQRTSAGGVPTISDAGDESFRVGEAGIETAGANFGSTQGAGFVRVCPSNDVNDANGVNMTITAWGNTGITFDVPATLATAFPRNTNVYLFVRNDAGQSNATGYVVQITPPPAVLAFHLLH